jgi:protein gp37
VVSFMAFDPSLAPKGLYASLYGGTTRPSMTASWSSTLGTGTHIEWTEATWNPIAGCKIVSPGCTQLLRHAYGGAPAGHACGEYAGTTRKSGRRHVWTGRVNTDSDALSAPLQWRKPKRIFVNSMSDLFQRKADERFIRQVWDVMERAHWHSFQVLTKRPERMLQSLSKRDFPMLNNVWLGTSVESADYLDRIDILHRVPARVRFISFEPLLAPIIEPNLRNIHWAIVGGESGPRARPMEGWWVEEMRDSCQRLGVAFFFKQWGGSRKKRTGRLLGERTWDDYPSFALPE